MAALALGAIAVPSSGAASLSALLFSNTKASSKLLFTRSSGARAVRRRAAITAAAYQVRSPSSPSYASSAFFQCQCMWNPVYVVCFSVLFFKKQATARSMLLSRL
jgi:hypothetical protein